jgi:hypothetical protein
MSALPPKADMFSVKIDVCFVPIADIALSPEGSRKQAFLGFRRRTVLMRAKAPTGQNCHSR